MLTIDRMDTRFRLAGQHDRRAHLARRLDRVASHRMAEMLEVAASDFAEDGEMVLIRRLDLTLWLNAARLEDAEIARRWAETLARALWRHIADAGPNELRRYPNRAAYLADWALAHAMGQVAGRWEFAEFETLADVASGRAIAHVLGRDPRWIGPTLSALTKGRLETVLARFRENDVAAIWHAWCEIPPRAPDRLEPGLVARVAALRPRPPLVETGDRNSRARTALRWLIALSAGPNGLPAPVAAGPAIALSHLSALLQDAPELITLLSEHGPLPPKLRNRMAQADLGTSLSWLEALRKKPGNVEGLLALAQMAKPPAAPNIKGRPEDAPVDSIRTPFAGLGLLLPPLRDLDLAERLGLAGRHRILTLAIPQPFRVLAESDPGLRRLAGLAPQETPVTDAVDWPDGAWSDQDAATHGVGPAHPTLRLVLDQFADGLRGMERASAAYLSRQFLYHPGQITFTEDRVEVRIETMPLRILLSMAGRLGKQGPVPWLGGRMLSIEAPDG